MQPISNIKHAVSEFNSKETNYPSSKDDWKRFEKNNPKITADVLCVKEMNISWLHFKTQLKLRKPNLSFNDSKLRRVTLCCSGKTICIIKNIKTCWWFLLFENKFEFKQFQKVCQNKVILRCCIAFRMQ